MKISPLVSSVAVVAIVAAGCAGAASSPAPSATGTAGSPSTAAAPVKVIYGENAQVELISSSGQRILIDVWDPTALSAPATAQDILLTSHLHADHLEEGFLAAFPGQKITAEEGKLEVAGISIDSIPAAHGPTDEIVAKGGSDYIFAIDIDGLRVVHFGDIGQNTLNADQMTRIGKVDVAFSGIEWLPDGDQEFGFSEMKQVKPLVFVPTHVSLNAATRAAKTWKATFAVKPLSIERSKLPAATTVVLMGSLAETYSYALSLEPTSL
jgi:hypothetical protein